MTRGFLCVVGLSCLHSSRLGAQIVEAGIARDAKLGSPLECLHVALLDSTGSAIAHTVTDSAGQFQLEAPQPGAYRLQFLVYGWEPLVGPVDTLADGSFKQRIYPLTFANMLVPDSSYERPREGVTARETRDKYKRLETYLRGLEGGTWRSRRAIPQGIEIRYPDRLRAAGVAGSVLGRFIVDSTGRARTDSWLTIAATHPAFENAVRGSLQQSRWQPALNGSRAVCELIFDYTRFYLDYDVARIVFQTR